MKHSVTAIHVLNLKPLYFMRVIGLMIERAQRNGFVI